MVNLQYYTAEFDINSAFLTLTETETETRGYIFGKYKVSVKV